MSKIKKFFEEWWGLFAAILIPIIVILLLCKVGHFIDLKTLHSYDYVSIDGIIYNTEDIDDISCFKSDDVTFYIKGTTNPICTTHYTYFNKGDLNKYLRATKVPEIEEKEILID